MPQGVTFVALLQNTQAEAKFRSYSGDMIGLPCDANHLVYRWCRDDCLVLFSVCRRGDAASCHFASDKRGLRHLKQAINEFTEFVFDLFKWCTMSLAIINKKSVMRLVEKCNYVPIAQLSDIDGGDMVYMRLKNE